METDHFSWDDAKAAKVLADHGVDFWDAAKLFEDPRNVELPEHTWHEPRFKVVGMVDGRAITVIHGVDDAGKIRMITAWRASREEMDAYFKENA